MTGSVFYNDSSSWDKCFNLTLSSVKIVTPLGGIDIVPVWIDNSYRILPKGFAIPVPLQCSITFGPPLTDLQGPTTLAIVDARNPASLLVYPEYSVDGLQGIYLANGNLYTVSNAGLTIYSVTLP